MISYLSDYMSKPFVGKIMFLDKTIIDRYQNSDFSIRRRIIITVVVYITIIIKIIIKGLLYYNVIVISLG
jgi:hypothetical protein